MKDINNSFFNKILNVMIMNFNMTDVMCDFLVFVDCNHAVIINEKRKNKIEINHLQFLQDVMYTDDLA